MGPTAKFTRDRVTQRSECGSGVDGTHLQTLEGNTGLFSLAVGLDGKIYSSWNDSRIRVWSGVDVTHLQTLHHVNDVRALVVGLDGKIYSGSDVTPRYECGDDDAHSRGHCDSLFLPDHHSKTHILQQGYFSAKHGPTR